MAFPSDFSNVEICKIHPAIGIARVSNNDDFYIFGNDPGNYKSGGLIKRQAVQFRIFVYGENNVGLGELTPQVMSDLGITAIWSAKVANRKIARLEGTPLSGNEFVISAEATSNDANSGQLVGSLPDFDEGSAIPLGQITREGVFIPPKGGVYRKSSGVEIEPYPALSAQVADTSCDGSVSVNLTIDGAGQIEVLPACIIVAPQDFSPDTNEGYTLNEYLKDALDIPLKRELPPVDNIHNQTAREIDEEALKTGSADFAPGYEVSLGGRGEVLDIRNLVYRSQDDPRIDPREVRILYKNKQNKLEPRGAVPGQLTSGLCSSWQGDFTACVGYWVEHLPPNAFLDEDASTEVRVFRKQYSDTSSSAEELRTGEEFNIGVDKVGIVRLRESRKVETERDPGDDI
ncbi:LodA/GoxA family CTQ-dependent oxidase [Acaryochloris marina]|uniref:L-Lysine epsilon oxidase N-terminal domain-containing protein n=1 Tax=Acaryochloris marina (strain MBIC 11017) TaxID=329726 RepID=B0C5X6_ACAM1|nr:LodA/GoxA family CTQ-dependent oxidase [Acaryochloris marina]ABW29988.1 hypothetical protein AM1_5022 [Acaryochloris marina MBIC11017]